MIEYVSIVENDMVIHNAKTEMMTLVVEIECVGMNADEFDKKIGSSDGLQPKQADLSCVHTLNEPYLHEIHVIPKVLMIEYVRIVETDMVIHNAKTNMMKLVVEIECVGMSADAFDKETESSDGLQPEQADLNCVNALNEPHLHEIYVVLSKHEADQHLLCAPYQFDVGHKFAPFRRKSVQKLSVHLKLFQFHVVDVRVIEE
nr:hypothetical protein [Tanacetum cinerariifolium]